MEMVSVEVATRLQARKSFCRVATRLAVNCDLHGRDRCCRRVSSETRARVPDHVRRLRAHTHPASRRHAATGAAALKFLAQAQATALAPRNFGRTMRADVWWSQPLLIFLGLASFIVCSTWAAFQGNHY